MPSHCLYLRFPVLAYSRTWRWKQQLCLKHWHLPVRPSGITFRETVLLTSSPWELKTLGVCVCVCVHCSTSSVSWKGSDVPVGVTCPSSLTFLDREGKKGQNTFLFYSSQISERGFVWKVPRICPLGFLIVVVLRWRLVWSIGGMTLMLKTRVLGENSVPVPPCPPQTLFAFTWCQTRIFMMRGQRIPVWIPYHIVHSWTMAILIFFL